MRYSRRFKEGDTRYMTYAEIDKDAIIITQNMRMDNPKIDQRNVVVLHIDDFKRMVKTLGINL